MSKLRRARYLCCRIWLEKSRCFGAYLARIFSPPALYNTMTTGSLLCWFFRSSLWMKETRKKPFDGKMLRRWRQKIRNNCRIEVKKCVGVLRVEKKQRSFIMASVLIMCEPVHVTLFDWWLERSARGLEYWKRRNVERWKMEHWSVFGVGASVRVAVRT